LRRWALLYVLIPAVLIAAAGLAYFSYTYSSELSSRERHVLMDTMAELGAEKVVGIQSEILRTESAVLDALDLQNLLEFQEFLRERRPAIESVVILDQDGEIIPGGVFTRRTGKDEQVALRELVETRLTRDLGLARARPREVRHAHVTYDGIPYLFSYTRRVAAGRSYLILLEADLSYLVGTVFPQFFGVTSPHLYQVTDTAGDVVYGYAFTGVPAEDVVEVPLGETLSQWKLRITRRDLDALSQPRTQEILGLSLTGIALAVILGGLGALVWNARQERRANQLKSDFISNVSHELKTPLSIISMFGELLATGRTKSPEQATEYAEIIRRESLRLTRLIDNVLDFAKIERGHDVYEFAEGDVADVVARALEMSKHRLERAKLELDSDLEADLPPARLDANAFTLAVLNLVDNAIKYAAEGERLAVSLRGHDGGLELEVRDFGRGIPADEQPQIFERFYRARDVRLLPIRGSGIGLALVKHIAEAHGGRVRVDSAPGQGARFRIWIPAARPV
jgi:two-component system, OmpR family, phosphate regulon sensor histidine kinase PhoR